ncbi:MAG: AsmA family protein [Cryomorphaceae bacterium]|nr:AsmA family protein [Cryomorphaceae bacterium]
MKKWLKWLGIVFLIILLIPVGIITWAYYNQDRITEKALTEINEQFEGVMVIDKTSIAPFVNFPYVSIDLKNARYYPDKARSGKPIYRIEDIYVGFDVKALLRGQYEIKKIHIQGGEIHLVRDENGQINLLTSKKFNSEAEKDSTSSEVDFNIQSASIENVLFIFDDSIAKREYDLHLDQLKLTFRSEKSHLYIDIQSDLVLDIIENGELTFFHDKQLHLNWKWDWDKPKGIINVFPSKTGIGAASFILEGMIDLENDLYLDLHLKGEKPDFALFTAFAPPEIEKALAIYQNAGRIYFDGKIQGRAKGEQVPRITANFGCENVFFRNKEVDRTINDLQFQGFYTNGEDRSLTTSEFHIKNFQARPEQGDFKGSVFIRNFNDPYIKVNLHADLDLEFIGQFFQVEGLRQIRGKILLDMDFDELIDIQLPGENLAQLKSGVDSELRFIDLTFAIPDYPHTVKNLNGAAIMRSGRVTLENTTFQLDNSKYAFSGSVSDLPALLHGFNKEIEIALRSNIDKMDFSRLIPVNPENDEVPFDEIIEDFFLDIAFKGVAKELMTFEHLPQGTIKVNGFKAKLNHFPHAFHDFGASIAIEENAIRVSNFQGEIDSSDFMLSARIDNYKKWFLEKPQGDSEFWFNIKSKKLRMNDLLTYKGENYLPEDYRNEQIKDMYFQGHLDLHFNDGFTSSDLHIDKLYGKLNLHPLALQSFTGRVHFEDEHLTIEKLYGKMGKSDFTIGMNYFLGEDKSQQRHKNTLSIKSKVLDLDALLGYEEHKEETDHEEAFNIFEVPFADMDISVTVGQLNYHKYWLENFHSDIRIQSDHYVYVDTLKMNIADGAFQMKGYFNGNNPEKIYYYSDIKMNNLDIDKLMVKFDNLGQDEFINEKIHGKITGTISSTFRMHPDLTPIVEESEAHMELMITKGSLVKFTPMLAMSDYFKDKNLNLVRFDTLSNVMDLKNGNLSIPAMNINSSLGFMEISGTQSVDLNMEYFVRIPLKMVTKVGWNALFSGKSNDLIDEDQVDDIQVRDADKRVKFLNLKISGNPDDFKVGLGKDKKPKSLQ